MISETPTLYLKPTTREVMSWMDRGLCPWCGGTCASGRCRLRYCNSCSERWIAATEIELGDRDIGGIAQQVIQTEDCPPCAIWWATLHLENPALNSAPADWMRPTTEVLQ